MRRTRFAAKGVAATLVATLAVAVAAGAVTLDPEHYYCFPIGASAIPVQTLSAAAAERDFTVLNTSDNTVSILHGIQTPSDNVQGMLDSASRLLVLDSDHFYLRSAGHLVTYAIRPAAAGYELVVSPATSVDLEEALTSVLMDVQDLGVLRMDIDLDSGRSFARNALKGPAEPLDLAGKLDYVLYGLTVSEDWFVYAHAKGLALLGLDIEVVAEKLPGETSPAAFSAYVVSESSQAAELILPIEQLVALAQSNAVGYVRLPYVPVAP